MTRDEAAKAFAEKMGWEVEWGHLIRGAGELTITAFYRKVTNDGHVEPEDEIEFPAPDAPLHEKLAFVGRVAEAITNLKHEQRYIVRATLYALIGTDWSRTALIVGLKELKRRRKAGVR